MNVSRRSLITGIGCIIAAPAIVRASSLMAIKPLNDWVTVPARIINLEEMTAQWIADIDADNANRAKWRRMNMERLRELLLPGLYAVQGDYAAIPEQWNKLALNQEV